MERVGRATCTGPSRTGLAARVAESEAGAERMNGARGRSDMHGNAARVAESEAGAERMKLLGTGGGRASVEPYGTQPR